MCAGVLPELEAVRQLLERSPEWSGDARAVSALQLGLLSTAAERYSEQGELHWQLNQAFGAKMY